MKTETSIVPFDFNGAEIRTIVINGIPWFIVVDVCRVLSIANVTEATRSLDRDELDSVILNSGKQGRKFVIVNESGLYRLIFRSRKPEAERFTKWVTNEVLPSIRQTGRYTSPSSPYEVLLEAMKEFGKKAIIADAATCAVNKILPKANYGEIAANGLPKYGMRRASFTAAPGRNKDAKALYEQMPLLNLSEEGKFTLK